MTTGGYLTFLNVIFSIREMGDLAPTTKDSWGNRMR